MARADTTRGLDLSLYGGKDPRDTPRYSYVEAARATAVPDSTIQAWVRGMGYGRRGEKRGFFSPLIERPNPDDTRLSFNNLLEVHVLRSLREAHEVRVDAIREAMRQARVERGIERLLIDPKLRTTGGALFLDYYFELVELSKSRQMAMRTILKQFLQRIELDDVPKFFPVPRIPGDSSRKIVMVSPLVAFGDAVIGRIGVSTHAVTARVNAGEDRQTIMKDYDLNADEFEEAILYEAAA